MLARELSRSVNSPLRQAPPSDGWSWRTKLCHRYQKSVGGPDGIRTARPLDCFHSSTLSQPELQARKKQDYDFRGCSSTLHSYHVLTTPCSFKIQMTLLAPNL